MSDYLLKAAQAELNALREKIQASPLYKRMQAVEKFIREYKSIEVSSAQPVPLSGNLKKIEKYGRQGSVSATVIEAAEAYLRSVKRRAPSGEILGAIRSQIPENTSASTISAYLSTCDLFDNERGQGYGLREWRDALNEKTPGNGLLPGVFS